MNMRLPLAVVLLVVACQLPHVQTPNPPATRSGADVVHVAPRAGETEADRASILASSVPRFERTECPFDTSALETEGLRCGYLTVPESRGKDDGRTLRIAVAVVEVPDATEDPVVLLPGGPGGGALQYHELVRRWLPSGRSLVLFDPRGTGHSGPLLCQELNETESAIAALDLSVEEARLMERGAHLACRDRLLRQGVDLDAYNSTSIALDVRDLRRALGYERWNLLAVSYGVPLARSVIRLEPETIRSAILAIGPGPVPTELLRMDVPFFARALERVFHGCAAEPSCREVFPDLEEEFHRVWASLKKEPHTVQIDPGEFHGDTFTVNSQDYVLMIYRLLGSEEEVAHLPALIRAFDERDEDVVRRMVEREYGGLRSSFSVGMASSVMCYDAHTPRSRAEWREAAAPYPPALGEIKYFLLPCDDWGEARASEEQRAPFRSTIPTLVVTGEFDPGSSPVRDEAQLRWLPNGHHVTIPGMGHFPESRSMACWASLVEQFVRSPQHWPDESCTEELPEVKIVPDLPSWAESKNQDLLAPGATEPGTVREAGIVHVASPTGEQETDRASILAALEKVEPGGTVQFAPGTYLMGGQIIHVTVPGITVLGHPEGTILRGCDPEDGALGRMLDAVVQCNGLDMAGGRQTVRDLTFEYAWSALVLGGLECRVPGGCRPHGEPVESRVGGYRVEGNRFHAVANAVRTLGQWDDPAVIRDNEFIDTFHAVVVHGSTVHVLGNDIRSSRPERIPDAGHPGGALLLSATDLNLELSLRCAGNVIEGNRVEGHPTAIGIFLLRPGTSCRDNVIRGNTIRIARDHTPDRESGDPSAAVADAPAVGIPISLVGSREAFGWHQSAGAADRDGALEDNLIEGNRVLGAEGLAIELFRASRNRIVDNKIFDVRRRQPFPGRTVNSTDPEKSGWRDANGSGIWLSPGSDGNEILGNTFEDVATAAVVLEGDRNRVVVASASDVVRDLGIGNLVIRPEESGTSPANRSAAEGATRRHDEEIEGDVPEESIDAIFSDLDREDSPRCAVGVYRAGEVAFAKGYGMASLENGVPLSSRSVLGVASVAKQFTALAVALLAQRGELSLHDRVRRHLPELPVYAAGVTVRQLIHHTSGIRDYFALLRLARGRVDETGDELVLSVLGLRRVRLT